MSIKYKLENAVKKSIERVAEERQIQVLTSQEASDMTLTSRRVIIQALQGHPVSMKARVLRMQLIIMVERLAIPDADDSIDKEPTLNHSLNVDGIHQALEDTSEGMAELLSGQMTDFTCFLVNPMGEIHDPPHQRANCLRDTWGYVCTCCEADC